MAYKTDGLAYQVKAPVTKLTTQVWFPGYTRWMERTNFHKLSPDASTSSHTKIYQIYRTKVIAFMTQLKYIKPKRILLKMLYLTGIVPYLFLQLCKGYS